MSSDLSGGHQKLVANLYDKLFSFEVKKASSAYPIHKKLDFEDDSVSDIYQWLVQELVLENYQSILDAGCGVGFGCQTLARHCKGLVTGISLSGAEIEQAKGFAHRSGVTNIQFEQQSFESLPPNRYDCIVMVESLKHCSDLSVALHSISQALTPEGVCYVVEDLYSGGSSSLAQQLKRDWQLKQLWQLSDFQQQAALAGLNLSVDKDLTPWVNVPALGVTMVRLGLFSVLGKLYKRSVLPIYRGGFLLDWFYARKQMQYQLLTLRKQA